MKNPFVRSATSALKNSAHGVAAHILASMMAGALCAQTPAVGPRITPPTIREVSPMGASLGTTVEMTVEGLNLAHATAVYFSQPGLKATIVGIKELPDLPDVRLGANGTVSTVDVGPLPPRNEVKLQLEIAPDAAIGPVAFRVQTPLGTSPEGRFLVEPHYTEVADTNMNDTAAQASEVAVPALLTGAISKQGDADYFKLRVHANQQLVFENDAAAVGSMLQPVVTILREDQSVVKEFGRDGMQSASAFACTFDKEGTYYVKITDFAENGSPAHFYRFKVGDYSLATMAYPLGFRRGSPTPVTLTGFNIKPGAATPDLKNAKEIRPISDDMFAYRPAGLKGESFRNVKLGVWDDPEAMSQGMNRSLSTAMPVNVPATVNGILESKAGKGLGHYYKFHAKKSEAVVFEIAASRLGSDLDSKLEILDAKGSPIERATVRAILETNTTLRDHSSVDRGIRLVSPAGLEIGDYLMIGNEIDRIQEVPRTPDNDTFMENFGGQRITYFGTTPEAHAIDKPAYKVRLFPPGRQFSPNGLPLVHLYYQNDDGGPGFERDSYLEFTAPAEADYYVRVSDTRGETGPRFAYRLNIRPARPDFRLSLSPDNPNVPLGGTIPITLTTLRLDGFDGPIAVKAADLPPGLHATDGAISAGQSSGTILLSADQNASLTGAVPLKVEGRAESGKHVVAHWANPNDPLTLVALMPQSDIAVQTPTKIVELEPGGSAQVSVSVVRQNGYRGRVPVSVWNLPPQVRVPDIGLNGVLISEKETQHSFTLQALPNAQPLEQVIYVAGDVETRSPLQNVYAAPQPILLRVKPKSSQLATLSH